MSVLVLGETNLLLFATLDQGLGYGYLRDLARQGRIVLGIPEIALREARGSLLERWQRRRVALEGVLPWINDIARSGYAQERVEPLRHHVHETVAWLRDMERLTDESLDAFARVCRLLPHTPEAMMRGHLRHLAQLPPFKSSNCELYECVLQFLREHAADFAHVLFLNLDREDFDHPSIHSELAALHAELLFSVGDCIQRLREILVG